MEINLEKITRFEVIDETGRAYTRYFRGGLELQVQDDGRTLKVFVPKKWPKDERLIKRIFRTS